MVKIKKKILLILAVVLLGVGVIYRPVQADSGWDSDYDSGWDSGSSWDSGSDWSSSDWDYDSDWSSSGGGGGGSLFGVIMVVVIIVIVISIMNNRNGGNKGNGSSSYRINNYNDTNNYDDVDINKIKEIDPELNINEFKTKVFRTYKDIQTAWMNFDTDTIRKLTTDEVYNMYSSQLETLKLKKQKNIMKNIELIDVKITDIRKENDTIRINAYLNVRCYDYVIKESTNEVVRGRDNAKINIKYMLTFVKSSDNNKLVEKCPNCGAPVDIVSSAECPYCDSTLVKTSSDYVMSKKVSLGQILER